MDRNCLLGWNTWNRVVVLLGLGGLGVLAFFGRNAILTRATALPPAGQKGNEAPASVQAAAANYASRPVAYVFGNKTITRQDLGEYLIARQGKERLELLVNKYIVDQACRDHGITVTDAEVEQDFKEVIKGMNIQSSKDFEDKVLKKYQKTLYEYKEDAIRPKLALTKLCQSRVQVTDKDLQDAFEAYYGEKIECRIILWPQGEDKIARTEYETVRKSDEEFDRKARSQATPSLASCGGRIPPFGRHSFGNEAVEKEAFSLKEGELSSLIGTPEGTVLLKCVHRIPPNASKKMETERAALEKDIRARKVQMEIPLYFKELRDRANPQLFLKEYKTESDWLRDVGQLIADDPDKPAITRVSH